MKFFTGYVPIDDFLRLGSCRSIGYRDIIDKKNNKNGEKNAS